MSRRTIQKANLKARKLEAALAAFDGCQVYAVLEMPSTTHGLNHRLDLDKGYFPLFKILKSVPAIAHSVLVRTQVEFAYMVRDEMMALSHHPSCMDNEFTQWFMGELADIVDFYDDRAKEYFLNNIKLYYKG